MPETIILKVWDYLRQHRRQIFVFIICLAVSLFLWLTIILNRYYVNALSFNVKISDNGNNGQLIPMQKNRVFFEIRAQGYQLLFNELAIARNRSLTVRRDKLKKSRQPGMFYITSRSLITSISSRFPSSSEFLNIRPDTLFFKIRPTDSFVIKEEIPEVQPTFTNIQHTSIQQGSPDIDTENPEHDTLAAGSPDNLQIPLP